MSDEPLVDPLDFEALVKTVKRFPQVDESDMIQVPGPLRPEPSVPFIGGWWTTPWKAEPPAEGRWTVEADL